MSIHAPAAAPATDAQLGGIADRLMDIAALVAAEAEAATALVRGMVDQAARVAVLAEAMEAAACSTEEGVRRQAGALTSARTMLGVNAPVIERLGHSIDGVASISTTIAGIARDSRILSLNARIEAARSDVGTSSFAVVAAEMSTLTGQLMTANADIGDRARGIAQDMSAAGAIVAAHGALVIEQDELLVASLQGAGRQRDAAADLAAITGETVETVDAAAAAIGRVGASAVAMKVLARQLARLTG